MDKKKLITLLLALTMILSLAANAEMRRESIMQRTSKSAVIFLNFIA